MAQSPPTDGVSDLGSRLEEIGRAIGAREAGRADQMHTARVRLGEIRSQVERALRRFHAAASEAGAPHLRVEISEMRIDEKHLRAVEFELSRGRHRAIFVSKDRGEITMVGPFRTGKTEGPCKSLPFGSDADSSADPNELNAALGDFLAAFLEEAASP